MPQSPPDTAPETADDLHPQFVEAVKKLMILGKQPSDDPEVRACIVTAIQYAPPALLDNLIAECRKQGILPVPDFYTEDGRGLHDIEKAARHTGLSVQQIEAELQKLAEQYPDKVLSEAAQRNVQRVH